MWTLVESNHDLQIFSLTYRHQPYARSIHLLKTRLKPFLRIVLDSNQRRRKPLVLQTSPFNHSGNNSKKHKQDS